MREMEEPSAKIVGIFQQQALTARGRVREGLTLVVED
jgi:hypothetical protein